MVGNTPSRHQYEPLVLLVMLVGFGLIAAGMWVMYRLLLDLFSPAPFPGPGALWPLGAVIAPPFPSTLIIPPWVTAVVFVAVAVAPIGYRIYSERDFLLYLLGMEDEFH